MSEAARKAAVTGGGSGIGRAICLRLARMEIDVAVLDVNREGAEKVAKEVEVLGRRAVAVAVDVADSASVAAARERVLATLGPVAILVNDAGIADVVRLQEMDEARWDRMIGVHLKGTYNCTRAFLPDVTAAGGGRIVNVTSVAGLTGGGPGLSHYAAAKGGIIGFTKALAYEVGPTGVTVNAVAPGLIDTPMTRHGAVSEELFEMTARTAPMRRVGRPEDIAAAVAYLVAEDASFITGQVISPNGGRMM